MIHTLDYTNCETFFDGSRPFACAEQYYVNKNGVRLQKRVSNVDWFYANGVMPPKYPVPALSWHGNTEKMSSTQALTSLWVYPEVVVLLLKNGTASKSD